MGPYLLRLRSTSPRPESETSRCARLLGFRLLALYRGAQLVADPLHARRWSSMKLDRYDLSHANEALAAVASGAVLKALIDPRQ